MPAVEAWRIRLQLPKLPLTTLGEEIRQHDYEHAYNSFANKAEFTEQDFMLDLTGYYPSLRTYATLQNFRRRPLHSTDNEADVQLDLHWSTVVGTSTTTRDLRVVKNGDRWEPDLAL